MERQPAFVFVSQSAFLGQKITTFSAPSPQNVRLETQMKGEPENLPDPYTEENPLQKLDWNFDKAVALFQADFRQFADVVLNRLPNFAGVGRQDYTVNTGPSTGEFGYVEKKPTVPTYTPPPAPAARDKAVKRAASENIDFLKMSRDMGLPKKKK